MSADNWDRHVAKERAFHGHFAANPAILDLANDIDHYEAALSKAEREIASYKAQAPAANWLSDEAVRLSHKLRDTDAEMFKLCEENRRLREQLEAALKPCEHRYITQDGSCLRCGKDCRTGAKNA